MRIRLKTLFIGLCLIPPIVLIGTVVSRLLGFINIFFEHSGIVLTQEDVAAAYNSSDKSTERPQLIPKITHQVFHNWRNPGDDKLPEDWAKVRQTCIDHNPDFEHMVRRPQGLCLNIRLYCRSSDTNSIRFWSSSGRRHHLGTLSQRSTRGS